MQCAKGRQIWYYTCNIFWDEFRTYWKTNQGMEMILFSLETFFVELHGQIHQTRDLKINLIVFFLNICLLLYFFYFFYLLNVRRSPIDLINNGNKSTIMVKIKFKSQEYWISKRSNQFSILVSEWLRQTILWTNNFSVKMHSIYTKRSSLSERKFCLNFQ